MDEFLLITGEDWIEMDDSTTWINTVWGYNAIAQLILERNWNTISPTLEDLGLIPENHIISDAKLYSTGEDDNPYRFWYKL